MSFRRSAASVLVVLAIPLMVSCGFNSNTSPSAPIVDMDPLPTEDPNKNLELFKIIEYSPSKVEAEKEIVTLGSGPILNYFFVTDPKVAGVAKGDSVNYEVFLVKTSVTNPVKNLEACFNLIMNERPHLNKADLFTVMRTNLSKEGKITPTFWSVEFE